MRVDAVLSFADADDVEEVVTFRVATIARPFMCNESGRTFATLDELRSHKRSLRALRSLGHDGAPAQFGSVRQRLGVVGAAGGSDEAKEESNYSTGAMGTVEDDEIALVRCFRVTLADVAFQLRPLPDGVDPTLVDGLRAMSTDTLKSHACFSFWAAYLETLADKPTAADRAPDSELRPSIGQLVTLPGKLMESIAPVRMEVPFCVDLTASLLFDEAKIRQLFHQAAHEAQKHCQFPSWLPRNKTHEYFDIQDISVGALHNLDEPAGGSRRRALSRKRRRPMGSLDAAAHTALVEGPPFMIRLSCQGSGEVFEVEIFVRRLDEDEILGSSPGEPVLRMCKADLGFPDLRADNVWALEAGIQILATNTPDAEDNGVKKLPTMPDTPAGVKARDSMTAFCLLQRRCITVALRSVGLHVWDTSRIVQSGDHEFLLVTAPPHVLSARAEKLGMLVRVLPDPKRDGVFNGGFTPEMFLRHGPIQPYFRGTPASPYLYKNYFAPFTPVQRQMLVLDLVVRPRNTVAGDNDVLTLRAGGADLNPSELAAEGVIMEFFPLHDEEQVDHLNKVWIKLPRAMSHYARASAAKSLKETLLALRGANAMVKRLKQAAADAERASLPQRTPNEGTPGLPLTTKDNQVAPEPAPGSAAPEAKPRISPRGGQLAPLGGSPSGAGGSSHSLGPVPLPTREVHSGGGSEVAVTVAAGGASPAETTRGPRSRAGGAAAVAGGGASGAVADSSTSVGPVGRSRGLDGAAYSDKKRASSSSSSRLCRSVCGCCITPCTRRLWASTLGQLSQPLDEVAAYFGTEVAFYFLWMQSYTQWLLPPAVLGVISVMVNELSNSDAEVRAADTDGQEGLTLGNMLTFIFAMVMLVWATLALESFNRNTQKRAHMWGVVGFEGERERVRPDYIRLIREHRDAETWQVNELTRLFSISAIDSEKRRASWRKQLRKDLEVYNELWYFPNIERTKQYWFSAIVCLITVAVVLVIMVGVLTVPDVLFGPDSTVFGMETRAVASGISNGLVIPLLNYLYFQYIARWLNDREMHRFHSTYNNSLIIKLFVFQFVNSYCSLFVIAFWFQDIDKLGSQLAGILITGQIIGIVKQHFITRLVERFKRVGARFAESTAVEALERRDAEVRAAYQEELTSGKRVRSARERRTRAMRAAKILGKMVRHGTKAATRRELDKNVSVQHNAIRWSTMRQAMSEIKRMPTGDLIPEYLTAIIQFGYVAMFCAAFPLAPLAAFVNNVFETRLDGYKFLMSRRSFARQSSGIGVWYTILQLLSIISVFTNVLIIYIETLRPDGTSKFTDIDENLTAVGAVWVTLALEHVLIVVKLILRAVTPDTPGSVDNDKFREHYFSLKVADNYAGEVQASELELLGPAEGVHDDSDGESDFASDEDDSGDDGAAVAADGTAADEKKDN